MARKLLPPPMPARSFVDSKAMRRPSPLRDGLTLTPSSLVFVTRRSPPVCDRDVHSPARQSASARQRKTAKGLRRSTEVLLRYRRKLKLCDREVRLAAYH